MYLLYTSNVETSIKTKLENKPKKPMVSKLFESTFMSNKSAYVYNIN